MNMDDAASRALRRASHDGYYYDVRSADTRDARLLAERRWPEKHAVAAMLGLLALAVIGSAWALARWPM
jgi:hypothetical protein